MTLRDWLPGRIFWNDADVEASTVEWLHCDLPRFDEPFLDDTYALLTRRPANVLFRRRTSLAELEAWAADSPGIPPTGFVFHVSRCGSTLLARLLGSLDHALVLSEPGPVDSIIRAGDRLGRDRQISLLRAIVSALGQPRTPGQNRLFIKFDAWNTLHLPLVRAAFPEVPWVFLHRDPVEVLVSALTRRGVHTVPGFLPPAHFGLADADARDPQAYAARVLGAIYQAGLDHHDPARGLALNYTALPGAAWTIVARHFGLTPTAGEVEALRAASAVNPKQGDAPFQADGAAKRDAASPEVRALADRWMRPAYQALEA
ncbi:sulfotransferase family protein [Brevundimonas lenta]|uniref:Aspartyl beta-hydroxylase n=1 Tax=Brevundimonas lenta TaxID=424796 RepID=A0A7W6JBX1_9CAUL|nr:sulfotransferase family protein [Brevundimonas lenta]MBB4082298.1 hypothetical protein [Brevundimonas lenta]